MKKITCVFLACLMLLCACNTSDTVSVSDNNSEASSVEDASSQGGEVSEKNDISQNENQESEVESVKNHPTVSGTFVQLWAFANYTDKQWENHFEKLLEVGIDTVIVQWTATTPYGKFSDCYYDTALAKGNATEGYVCYSSCISKMFKAAKKTDTKIILGLNISDEWWQYSSLDAQWGVTQAELGLKIARELYDAYYEEYKQNFAGWYWAWELYNNMSLTTAATAGEFINLYIDGLTEIDPEIPLMLSPFITEGAGYEATEKAWNKFFETARFREGDIFCCQDSVGAGHIKIENMDAYFQVIARAVAKEEGLKFWANNECFNSDYTPADLSRFVQQMEISKKYVEGHVTFAYSHYYHPDKYPALHQAYKNYYETGSVS